MRIVDAPSHKMMRTFVTKKVQKVAERCSCGPDRVFGKPAVDLQRGVPPARTPLSIKLVAQLLKEAPHLVVAALVNVALPARPRVS
jgi:hypothetical protein